MEAGLISFFAFWGTSFFTGGLISFFIAVVISRVVKLVYQKFVIGRAKPPPKSAAIITGCSSGIGLAAAIHLASEGVTVFAAVRKEDDFKVFKKNSKIIPFVLDVTKDSEIKSSVQFITERVQKDGYKLLGLVNNAGYAESGVLELLPIDKLRKQLDVNVIGQVAVTQAFLPLLRKYGEQTLRPRLIFISSGLGKITLPNSGAYSASKFAIEAIGNAFRMELQSWNIPVIVIQPGSIKTNFINVLKENTRNNTFANETDEVAKSYQASTTALLQNQVVMEKLFTTTQATNEVIEGALLDKRPMTRYQCGSDSLFGVPIATALPDKANDLIFARFFK